MNRPFSFIWEVMQPYKWYYLLMYLAPIVTGLYPIIYSYAVKILIDLFVQDKQVTFSESFFPIAIFVGSQILVDTVWRIHNLAQMKTIPFVFQDLMEKACYHCFHLPYSYFQNTLSGSIISKVKGIGDTYINIHQSLEWKLSAPLLTTLFSGIALSRVNSKIFLFILLFIIIYSPLAYYFFYKLSKIEEKRQDAWYRLFGTISDRITNIMTIFSFATRYQELRNIRNNYADSLIPISIRYYRYDFWISLILGLLYWIFLIGLFITVIFLRNTGEISIGDIAFVMALSFSFSDSAWKTTMSIKEFLEDIAAFKSAFSIMQEPVCTIDPESSKDLIVTKGMIEFKSVTFGYTKEKHIFEDLNLLVKAGEKIGIVGTSGAGKSTLIALLLKNFSPEKGEIGIDDQKLRDLSSDSIRKNIALIPQDAFLFHRSISENIGYANENASLEDIQSAAKLANIHEFILTLPDQYATLVGERGVKLSGGQRQRIAIARAILKNAPILILDEATSSLDSETENDIQSSLHELFSQNKTTVIAIAHRLSTIKHMDRIIVMENGKIIEEGSFEKLVEKPNGKFKFLWDHQVNGMLG